MTLPALGQDDIVRFQAALSLYEQTDLPVKHYFSPGLYLREIFMPKGTFVVGKLHATEHPNIISVGDCTVWTAHDGVKRYTGPNTWVSKAGVKKALYTHEDTIWTTVHVTETTDLIDLERELIIDQPIDGGYCIEEVEYLASSLRDSLMDILHLEHRP